MRSVLTVIGTRPEIVKISPVVPLLDERFKHILVHSGQHYSYEMDALFFKDLRLRAPDYELAVGSASHGEQTARILSRLEPVVLHERPDLLLVHGDTNTTLAAGLCAVKAGVRVAHMEAGCRSFNRAMPEEINRIVVDHLADLLLPPDDVARANLLAEGLPASKISVVGSSVIDAAMCNRTLAAASQILNLLGLEPNGYLVLTLHRAENTVTHTLREMLAALNDASEHHVIVFPIHPRTATLIKRNGLTISPRIRVCEPLGYIDMLHLVSGARAVLTDSGGLQEEAAVLGTPALVLRNETEWQYLIDAGVNVLIGNTCESICRGLHTWLCPERMATLRAAKAPIVCGASRRAVDVMVEYLETQ